MRPKQRSFVHSGRSAPFVTVSTALNGVPGTTSLHVRSAKSMLDMVPLCHDP